MTKSAPIPYSADIASRVLAGLRAGRSLSNICKAPDLPCEAAVRKWVRIDREGFADRYGRARAEGDMLNARRRAKLMDTIFGQLANGRSLFSVCRDPGMPPHNTVLGWVAGDRTRYDRVRQLGYEAMMDEILEIADDDRDDRRSGTDGQLVPNRGNVARSRLRVTTRQWLVAKSLPRKVHDETSARRKHRKRSQGMHS